MRRCFLFVLFVLFGSFAVCAEKGKEIKPLEILDIDRLVRAVDKQLRNAETTRDRDLALKFLYGELKNRRILIDPKRCNEPASQNGQYIVFKYISNILRKSSKHERVDVSIMFMVKGCSVSVDEKKPFDGLSVKAYGVPSDKYRTRTLTVLVEGIEQ